MQSYNDRLMICFCFCFALLVVYLRSKELWSSCTVVLVFAWSYLLLLRQYSSGIHEQKRSPSAKKNLKWKDKLQYCIQSVLTCGSQFIFQYSNQSAGTPEKIYFRVTNRLKLNALSFFDQLDQITQYVKILRYHELVMMMKKKNLVCAINVTTFLGLVQGAY